MDKPYLTYVQQLEKLQNEYGLIISDFDFALKCIKSFSYYDLVNGYQDLYINNGKYINGTTFEQLVALHIFNKNIQGVLIKYSTYVENSFKNILSNVIAKNISEDEKVYLDITKYKKKKNPPQRQKFARLIEKLTQTSIKCTDTPTSHYINTKNHIPPWILFRNVSFSNATDFLTFINPNDKNDFIDQFNVFDDFDLCNDDKYKILLDSAHIVRKFRNIIAHNLNFLSYRGSDLSKNVNLLFEQTLSSSFDLKKTWRDTWGMVMAIVILLNNDFLAHNFLAELQSFMAIDDNIKPLYCKTTGIPLDYEQRIANYIDSLKFT
ncbi:Abi family protein [Vallitaleaceae bacterium 9-2]